MRPTWGGGGEEDRFCCAVKVGPPTGTYIAFKGSLTHAGYCIIPTWANQHERAIPEKAGTCVAVCPHAHQRSQDHFRLHIDIFSPVPPHRRITAYNTCCLYVTMCNFVVAGDSSFSRFGDAFHAWRARQYTPRNKLARSCDWGIERAHVMPGIQSVHSNDKVSPSLSLSTITTTTTTTRTLAGCAHLREPGEPGAPLSGQEHPVGGL